MPDVVIIGGGIAGLATAFRLQTAATAGGRPLTCHLVESAPCFGGKIVTDREDDFLIEGGPDSIIPQKPWAMELIRELGLEDRLLPSNDHQRGTFVLNNGRLEDLPEGLQLLVPSDWRAFLRSPLLSWPAKLRFAAERWVPTRSAADDESVADFVRRRFGRGALDTLAEPLLAHIHVADIERMSLRATYPRLADLEDRHGSLHRAVAAQRSRHGTRPSGPIFWSLEGGLAELVDAVVEKIDPATRHLGRKVNRLTRAADSEGRRFVAHLENGRELAADAVVLATPAQAAGDVVAELAPDLATQLRAISYVSVATLSLGYRRADVAHPLDGFGFFVPKREHRRVLACTWTSTKFDHRAPDDAVLVRVFLGGAGNEQVLEQGDNALVHTVREDLAAVMGLTAEPKVCKLYRWPDGYPQYEVGHLERVRSLSEALPSGLFLAGSAYHGVGVPDCVRSGFEAASEVQKHLDSFDRGGSPMLNTAPDSYNSPS